jgi:hypothetical protein
VSLDDSWAGGLGDVELTMLYRIMNRLIEAEAYREWLPTKGEQDTAWAVKHEYERRLEAQHGVLGEGGVF